MGNDEVVHDFEGHNIAELGEIFQCSGGEAVSVVNCHSLCDVPWHLGREGMGVRNAGTRAAGQCPGPKLATQHLSRRQGEKRAVPTKGKAVKARGKEERRGTAQLSGM